MFSRKPTYYQAEDVQKTAQRLGTDACCAVRQAAGQSCAWMKNNPWVAIGAGTLCGLLAGMYLSGKKGD